MNNLINAIEKCKAEFLNTNVKRKTKTQTLADRSFAKGWNACNRQWMSEILKLSSVQPEIIRCKDCKHWFDIDDGRQLHKMCADICGDWFCADAERRTDDER